MIIGNGLIAKALHTIDEENTLFFASGVSNSLETQEKEFIREISLLKKSIEENPTKKLVYFSTLSIADQSKQKSPYILHKKFIEKYIHEKCTHYLILRIGNIVGNGGNPNTLFNFLENKIETGHHFNSHSQARRLLIDIDDIVDFIRIHLRSEDQQIVNLAFPHYYSMPEIIPVLEDTIGKKANYTVINEGDFYEIDFSKQVTDFFFNHTSENYLQRLTDKYLVCKQK